MTEFEERIAALVGLEPRNVVVLSNCTSALTLALLARSAGPEPTCTMPGWTFRATPNAAVAAGLQPVFVDVDPTTWQLDPAAAFESSSGGGHLIVVSPFGAPVDLEPWTSWPGPVTIDAAAAFDAIVERGLTLDDRHAFAISFHATKAFGIGEGGCIVTADDELAKTIRLLANHGYGMSRGTGLNAKLPEVSAAVGLAALDRWPQHRAALQARISAYIDAIGEVAGAHAQPGAGGWVSTSMCVRLPTVDIDRVRQELYEVGIEVRRPWGMAPSRDVSYGHEAKPLPNVDELADSVLGLPLHSDMPFAAIEMIVDALARSIDPCRHQDSAPRT